MSFQRRYVECTRSEMTRLQAVQVYSDGGKRDGHGAAANVIFGINAATPSELVLLEADCVFLADQTSAFKMEAIAIDRAVGRMVELSRDFSNIPVAVPDTESAAMRELRDQLQCLRQQRARQENLQLRLDSRNTAISNMQAFIDDAGEGLNEQTDSLADALEDISNNFS